RRGLETDERIDVVVALAAKVFLSLVHRQTGVALHVEDLDHLDVGIAAKDILVALEALIKVRLARHREEDDVAFAVEHCRCALASEPASVEVICANEVQTMARL